MDLGDIGTFKNIYLEIAEIGSLTFDIFYFIAAEFEYYIEENIQII